MDHHSLYNRLATLHGSLTLAMQKDSEQEITGVALPVLDALVSEAMKFAPNDPIVLRMHEIISLEQIQLGDPVRAVDALLVVGQLMDAIGYPEVRVVGRGFQS